MSKSINTTGEFYFGVFGEKLTAVYTSDPGHEKHEETRELGHTTRSKDETFTKKNNRTFFGYKGHILTDINPVPLIRSYAVTTASTHDSKIDLSKWNTGIQRQRLFRN